MSEPVAIERLLLSGERVLWEGRANVRRWGVLGWAAMIYFGLAFALPLLGLFFVLGSISIYLATHAWTPDLLRGQAAFTFLLAIVVGVVGWAVSTLVLGLRRERTLGKLRYYVTTRRALLVGSGSEDERIVELDTLAPVERAVSWTGTSVRLHAASGEVLVAFDLADFERPARAAAEIARVLADARGVPEPNAILERERCRGT